MSPKLQVLQDGHEVSISNLWTKPKLLVLNIFKLHVPIIWVIHAFVICSQLTAWA
jgi:hypothetical protein